MATKSNKATKPSTVAIAVPLSASLELLAAQVAGALQETASLSETLGELTIKAGKEIIKSPDMLAPFVDACRQMADACGLTEGSVKTYLSNIRGVLRAMIEGYKPKAGATLRSMYDAAPKGTGRQKAPAKSGARHATDKPAASEADDDLDDDGVQVATGSPADRKRAALVELFGHADDELLAAVSWAAAHEMRFVNIIKAQIEFDAKPATSPALRKAA